MSNGWIRLTSTQANAIAGLSAGNTTPNYIAPVADAAGDLWLSADVLTEPLFSHYAPVLSVLTVTQQQEPIWP